jgi:hypothetical protein
MIGSPPTAATGARAVFESAAIMARDTAFGITVVYPRRPGVVPEAWAAAQRVGVEATAEVRMNMVCVRFAPRPHPSFGDAPLGL